MKRYDIPPDAEEEVMLKKLRESGEEFYRKYGKSDRWKNSK